MEINIKEGMPSVVEAMEHLKSCVSGAKQNKIKTLEVIHGYGSTGVGGKIREKARQWLIAQEKIGKIKTVIFGEEFEMFNDKSRNLKAKYPELISYYEKGNHGITIVEI
ncbi:hypothetical protein EOM82_04275 [bacterium]|nr:hypothetical protein [bacterium]